MLPDDWATFFGIIVGAATALAGLLFVAFSIYVTSGRPVDLLAERIGTLYFGELINALVIGLAAVLPPHVWWTGAIIGAIAQVLWWIQAQRVASQYRKAFRSSRKELLPTGEEDEHAQMYKANRRRLNSLFVPLCESLLVFASGAAGGLAYVGGLPAFVPPWLPLQVAGFFAAWYLISGTVNSWLFLFRLGYIQAASGTQ